MTAGQRTRAKLAARDGWACCYCGRLTVEKVTDDEDRATIEHVIPRSRGGGDGLDNLRIACRWCNWTRGNGAFPTAQPPPLTVSELAAPCPTCRVPAGRPCLSTITTRPKRQVHARRLRAAHG